jgi:hypothetical protein
MDILANQAYEHSLIKINNFRKRNNNQIKGSCFTLQERYSNETFQGIILDTRISGVFIAGINQFKAL